MDLFDKAFRLHFDEASMNIFDSPVLFQFDDACTAVLLQFLCSPIAVLLLDTIISLSYRISVSFKAPSVLKQFLINVHAIATECCQVLLLVLGIVDTAAIIEMVVDMVGWQSVSPVEAAFLIEVVLAGSVVYHWTALVAVDVIESWITLGNVSHPYNGRPFVLTRNAFLSLWRWLKPTTRPLLPQPPSSSPPPPPPPPPRNISTDQAIDVLDVIKVRRARMYQRLAKKLDYLNLAGLGTVRGIPWRQFAGIVKLMGAHATFEAYAAKYRSGGVSPDEDLPTPPDSDQAKETKRVKWSPTMAVVSPSGTERWLSLP